MSTEKGDYCHFCQYFSRVLKNEKEKTEGRKGAPVSPLVKNGRPVPLKILHRSSVFCCCALCQLLYRVFHVHLRTLLLMNTYYFRRFSFFFQRICIFPIQRGDVHSLRHALLMHSDIFLQFLLPVLQQLLPVHSLLL